MDRESTLHKACLLCLYKVSRPTLSNCLPLGCCHCFFLFLASLNDFASNHYHQTGRLWQCFLPVFFPSSGTVRAYLMDL